MKSKTSDLENDQNRKRIKDRSSAEDISLTGAATQKIPRHIGIIMDGNGRWATKRHLPRVAGHRSGVKNITPIVGCALDRGVQCVTLYAFSTENKDRPQDEVKSLVELIRKRLKPMTRELIERGARVVFSGELDYFPNDVKTIIEEIKSENCDNASQTVNIALNYSGRSEIVRAARKAAEAGEITEDSLSKELYTSELPELDMIIRTGGEKRLSNFLLFQAAYSELFFTDTLWPDFGENELNGMIDEFSHRSRRFGKI